MRHRVRKGKLGLKTEHRLSVLRNLCTELFRHGRITSTDVKIKELRRFSEKIITTAKNDSVLIFSHSGQSQEIIMRPL